MSVLLDTRPNRSEVRSFTAGANPTPGLAAVFVVVKTVDR